MVLTIIKARRATRHQLLQQADFFFSCLYMCSELRPGGLAVNYQKQAHRLGLFTGQHIRKKKSTHTALEGVGFSSGRASAWWLSVLAAVRRSNRQGSEGTRKSEKSGEGHA